MNFLSQEEQECIQFFEETIDSLDDSLEEIDGRTAQVKPPTTSSSSGGPVSEADGPPTLSPKPGVTVYSLLARPPSPKDLDIIDLVRPEPDLVQTREPIFSPTNPGSVQQLVVDCKAITRIPQQAPNPPATMFCIFFI